MKKQEKMEIKTILRIAIVSLMVTVISPFTYAQDQSGEVIEEPKAPSKKDKKNRNKNRQSSERQQIEYSDYSNIYEAITDAIPEAQRFVLGNRRSVFLLRGNTSISGRNYAKYAVNGLLVENIDHIVLDRVTRIYKMPKSQLSIFGSQASGGIICISTE